MADPTTFALETQAHFVVVLYLFWVVSKQFPCSADADWPESTLFPSEKLGYVFGMAARPLRRLLFWSASAALALGVARAWAQRTRTAIEAEDQGLPANFDSLGPAEKRRAEKQRRKALRRRAK